MTKKSLFILLGIFYLLSLFIHFAIPYSEVKLLFQYTAIISSLGMGVIAGLYALQEYGLTSPKSTTLIFFTTGIACWLIGESLWTYYEYVLHTDPFPSIADIFYLCAYPLFFSGFVREIHLTKVNWQGMKKSLIFMMVMTSLLFGIVVSYFGVFLAYSPAEPLLTNIIAMSYGLGDLILIMSAMAHLKLAWEFKGGELSGIWFSLFFSFLFTLIADILFAIFTAQYNETGSVIRSFIDSIWILSYLFFAYALLSFAISIRSAHLYMQKLKSIKHPKHKE
jgi:hypothetical protein